MKRDDWLLIVLAAAKKEGLTPVRLQKSLFLLGENLKAEVGQNFYRFRPYNYGPFDSAVYTDAEILQSMGLVEIRAHRGSWPDYLITPNGEKRADKISQPLSKRVLDYVAAVVEWAQSLDFRDLIQAIYRKYPAMRANSVFRG